MTKLWLSALGSTPDGRPQLSSYEMIKYIVERNVEKDKHSLVYELSKVIDSKFDSLNGKLCDLVYENRQL